MDIAIVTGASSSLGLAISRRLIQLGFRVYGLGGDYKECPLQNVNFRPMACDLADPLAVDAACSRILEKEKGVFLLVNNAKFFGRNRFLEMDVEEMERILRINLLCPLVLVRNLAASLKNLQGYVIQLGAPHAESSAGGAAGAAASGGLKWMGEVLFHDLRDYGVKVCHLSPEPNRGRDPRTTARPGARTEASIDPEAVAQAVEQILQSPFGNVVTEMVLRPMRVREVEQDPVVRLPYPEPQPIPYTVPRELIEAEEQLDEEQRQEQADRRRERQAARKAEQAVDKEGPPAEAPAAEPAPRAASSPKPAREEPARQPAAREEAAETAERPSRPGRRHRRKPRPSSAEVGFLPRDRPVAAASQDRPPERKPEPVREPQPARQAAPAPADTEAAGAKPAPARKAARKRPARKPAAEKDATGRPPRVEQAAQAAEAGQPARKRPRRPAKKAAPSGETGKDSA